MSLISSNGHGIHRGPAVIEEAVRSSAGAEAVGAAVAKAIGNSTVAEALNGAAVPTPTGIEGPLPGGRALTDLKPGERGRVIGWSDPQPPSRLLEMGLLPGTPIELVRYAPLGDPIDLKLRGYHLSLRRREAGRILIEPL